MLLVSWNCNMVHTFLTLSRLVGAGHSCFSTKQLLLTLWSLADIIYNLLFSKNGKTTCTCNLSLSYKIVILTFCEKSCDCQDKNLRGKMQSNSKIRVEIQRKSETERGWNSTGEKGKYMIFIKENTICWAQHWWHAAGKDDLVTITFNPSVSGLHCWGCSQGSASGHTAVWRSCQPVGLTDSLYRVLCILKRNQRRLPRCVSG